MGIILKSDVFVSIEQQDDASSVSYWDSSGRTHC